MRSTSTLTTGEILAVFTEEVAGQGGSVTDAADDGRRLFARSVLPRVAEVRPRDRMQGGIALKASDEEVRLFPYFFRQVCRNGAIIAQTLESRSVVDFQLQDAETARQAIREGVMACCAEEVFSGAIGSMRIGCQTQVDLAIALLPLASRLSGSGRASMVLQIMDRFFRDGDRSRFGLANAITAVARDTQDQDLRWDLEELGGAVAIGDVPNKPILSEQLVTAS